jgi:hypothetical protein
LCILLACGVDIIIISSRSPFIGSSSSSSLLLVSDSNMFTLDSELDIVVWFVEPMPGGWARLVPGEPKADEVPPRR